MMTIEPLLGVRCLGTALFRDVRHKAQSGAKAPHSKEALL